jgi:hypothetical protein
MNCLHLEVTDSSATGSSRRVTRITPDEGGAPIEIFHEFDRIMPLQNDAPLDGHVLPVFLYAASIGKPLKVHGGLTRTALRNFEELSLLWNRWRPNLYHRFEIIPERCIDEVNVPAEPAAIAAFSGGVDSTFTALRHASSNPTNPRTRYPLRAALMVHGFDVDVYNFEDFRQLVERVRPLVDALGLDFRVLRTNSRDLRLQDWRDTASLQLAGCLHMFSTKYQYGLLGSTKAYDELVLPYGSCPLTDQLMTGGNFSVVHDGAGFSRTEKVAAIAQDPLACQVLKVCWAGADQSKNCGRCEKCIRSQLNFLAVGAKTPPAFPGQLRVDDVRTMEIVTPCQVAEFASLLTYARNHNIDGPWMPVLQEKLEAWAPIAEPNTEWAQLKTKISTSLAPFGLDEPTKKLWRSMRRRILKRFEQIIDSYRAVQ